MHKIRVGVIRGGPSNQYDVSLKTGASILNNLPKDKYTTRDIFIDKNGDWFVHGLPTKPHEALTHIDVAFNALHGHYGEDGKIQHIFEVHGIPFTGSGSFASAISMNKHMTKEVYRKEKMRTPQSVLIESLSELDKKIDIIFRSFPLPIVVKPVSSGSSVGITIAKDYVSFEKAIKHAFEHSNLVLVEEFIKGKEATCGVIDGYRDQEFYALPPVEICPDNGSFFDYSAKYEGKSKEIVPGNFTELEKREIESMAIQAHKVLGLSHYSRSDFIIHPKRGVFILESNTLPSLIEESPLPKSLKAVGASISHFLDHIVELAITRK